MLIILGLMIVCYGTARLLNDSLAKLDSASSKYITWLVSIIGIAGLWFLGYELLTSNAQGLLQ